MGKINFVKGFELNTPSWDEVLFNLNYSYLNQKEFKNSSPGFFVAHDAYKIPRVQYVLQKLKLKKLTYILIFYKILLHLENIKTQWMFGFGKLKGLQNGL